MTHSIDQWSDSSWGDGSWGEPPLSLYADNRNIRTASENWNSGITFAPESNTYKLVRALLSQAHRIDEDLEWIQSSHAIQTATGSNLEKIGQLVDVDRRSNESDASYRARIKATFRSATTSTTFNEFVQFSSRVLDTSIDNITFTTSPAFPASVSVSTDESVYNNLNLSNEDVKELLGMGVPAGHEVRILESGTFKLKTDGETDDPDKGLTSDSISTGGTLAEDVL